MNRREMLQGTAVGMLAATVVGADDANGPFAKPSVKFNPARPHELPSFAFTKELPIPLVLRPTSIEKYEDLVPDEQKQIKATAFGAGDPRPIGEVFHGVAREWGVTPEHWRVYGCNPQPGESYFASWKDKFKNFGTFANHDQADTPKHIANWGGFKVKCFKVPIAEGFHEFRPDQHHPSRVYGYGGILPGPVLKMRLGQPVVVRYENHLETETSIHLHGGHSPSHSDGFPSFYVLQGKARDYFYPNILPLHKEGEGQVAKYIPDGGEAQSTMWYHDHGMDATGFNVSKGLAGLAPCFGERELKLLHDRVLPGLGPDSCRDPERDGFQMKNGKKDDSLEDEKQPGYYKHELDCEPYFNPYDIPLVLQDKVIDLNTGQIAFDTTGHNGYLGDTMLVNGMAWPKLSVRNRKYRFRILDGSNARVFRLRLMKYEDYLAAVRDGVNGAGTETCATISNPVPFDDEKSGKALPFLRIGKDSWLWRRAETKKSIVLAMANRADIVIDFGKLAEQVTKPGDEQAFVLVNTMPQTNGRGPKAKLEDGGDPRVLPLPFDTQDVKLVELNRPVGLLKFVVRYGPPKSEKEDPKDDCEASVDQGTDLLGKDVFGTSYKHRPIPDEHVKAVRQFIFHRGKGAWQINQRFYDPTISNACPIVDGAEEWILENGGGGWWHPIHIHLESHHLIRYEKNFDADAVLDPGDPPALNPLGALATLGDPKPPPEKPPPGLVDVTKEIGETEQLGLHDTMVLGPNTRVRIRMRHRTWAGPFVFHCHNLEHEDVRMMVNFEPVPAPHDPNVVPDARTHGNGVTLGNKMGELPWEFPQVPAVPQEPVRDAGVNVVPPRKNPK